MYLCLFTYKKEGTQGCHHIRGYEKIPHLLLHTRTRAHAHTRTLALTDKDKHDIVLCGASYHKSCPLCSSCCGMQGPFRHWKTPDTDSTLFTRSRSQYETASVVDLLCLSVAGLGALWILLHVFFKTVLSFARSGFRGCIFNSLLFPFTWKESQQMSFL